MQLEFKLDTIHLNMGLDTTKPDVGVSNIARLKPVSPAT